MLPAVLPVMLHAPMLSTDRLVLDRHRPDDLDALAALWADPAVYGPIGVAARSREEVWIRLLRHVGMWATFGYGSWVVRASRDGPAVGELGLIEARRVLDPPLTLPEMGWMIAPDLHGRGFAGEAMGSALAWSDANGIARTTCIIGTDNAPSPRLAARLGYRPLREAPYHGKTVAVLER